MLSWLEELADAVPWQGWAAVVFMLVTTAALDFIKWRADRKRQEYREF